MNQLVRELDLQDAEERLATLAKERGVAPPPMIKEDGAPSSEFMAFCKEYGLTLDYIITGEGPKYRSNEHRNPTPKSAPTLDDIHYKAVLLSGFLENLAVLQNSGDGDMSAMVEIATERGDQLVRDIEETIDANSGKNPSPDQHPQWLEQWRSAKKGFEEAADEPEGQNFDSAKCQGHLSRKEHLEGCICRTQAHTNAGIAAQVEFALADQMVGGASTNGDDTELFRNILMALKGGAA